MMEMFKIIADAIKDFGVIILLFGGFCTAISGVMAIASARKRWRIRRHSQDFSNFLWPGEKYHCCSTILMTVGYLLMTAVAFTATFIVASIAAAALTLIVLEYRNAFCIITFLVTIIMSSCTGVLSQHLTEWFEDALLESIENVSFSHRQKRHKRSRFLRHKIFNYQTTG